ncbi:MAG: adenylyltransferase/cytidyltransferase family protein [Cellulomonas sp.]
MGSFDLLHLGHLEYLAKAARGCDRLVVAVDSDESVRRRKGPGRPFLADGERVEMLRHVRYVDAVVVKYPTPRRWDIVRAMSPDVLVVSAATYAADEFAELGKLGPSIIVLPEHPTCSTSQPDRIRGWHNRMVD